MIRMNALSVVESRFPGWKEKRVRQEATQKIRHLMITFTISVWIFFCDDSRRGPLTLELPYLPCCGPLFIVWGHRTAFRDPGHGTPELRHAPAKEGRSRLQSETRSARDRSLRSLRPCVTQAVLKAKNARTPEEGFFKES